MTKLKSLLKEEFKKHQIQKISTSSEEVNPTTIQQLQDQIASLEEELTYFRPYKGLFQGLEEPLYGWLLYGRVTIEELPIDVRMHRYAHAYTYAWRYVESKHDADKGMAILDLFQSDIIEFVHLEKFDLQAYGEYLKQWMDYLARGLSAFKDSKDYDNYFLKLQKTHQELFDEYIGDMEDNRDWVSWL